MRAINETLINRAVMATRAVQECEDHFDISEMLQDLDETINACFNLGIKTDDFHYGAALSFAVKCSAAVNVYLDMGGAS